MRPLLPRYYCYPKVVAEIFKKKNRRPHIFRRNRLGRNREEMLREREVRYLRTVAHRTGRLLTLYPVDLTTRLPFSSKSKVSLAKRKDPWEMERRC